MKSFNSLLAVVLMGITTSWTHAVSPVLDLGAKPAMGLFQPRVSVEFFSDDAGTQSLGPDASSFLLDTGASGVLIYPPATEELAANGFQNDGTFDEIGIGGVDTYDLSAPYRMNFVGTDGQTNHVTGLRALSGESAPDPTGLMGLNGIIGMPAMTGRVTSMDNRTREGALSLSMGVAFSDALPATSTHRFTVPLKPLDFPAEGEIVPTFESLSTLQVISQNGGNTSIDDIVLDSGAQITIISEAIATALGLDTNGNGDFSDEATNTVPLTGASGTVNAPVLMVDEFRIPTDQGFDLKWTDAEVVVFDIYPTINGVLGADFMTDDGGLDLSLVGGSGSGLTDLLGGLLGGGGGLDDLLGGLLGGDGGGLGGLDDIFGGGGLLGGGSVDLDGLFGDLGLGGTGGASAADTGDSTLDDLLGGLGGLGDLGGLLGGGSDLFASFPLESNFDQVHFDYRDFATGEATLVFDLNPEISASILNGDHIFSVEDIDDLTAAMGTAAGQYDLNGDGEIDFDDRDVLIDDVFGLQRGDADLDGDVDFADFLALSGSFGDDGGWGGGDFNGDGTTGFPDFLQLSGNFGQQAAASVPEPTSRCLLLVALIVSLCGRRRRSA